MSNNDVRGIKYSSAVFTDSFNEIDILMHVKVHVEKTLGSGDEPPGLSPNNHVPEFGIILPYSKPCILADSACCCEGVQGLVQGLVEKGRIFGKPVRAPDDAYIGMLLKGLFDA